jgi:hypothetical protein
MPGFGSLAPGGMSMMPGPSGPLPQTSFDNIMPMLARIMQMQRGQTGGGNGAPPNPAVTAPAPTGAQSPGLINRALGLQPSPSGASPDLINRALGMQPGVGLLNGLFGANKLQAPGTPTNNTPEIPLADEKASGQMSLTGMW